MEFYLSDETIQRSKFKFLKINDIINLELPLKIWSKNIWPYMSRSC